MSLSVPQLYKILRLNEETLNKVETDLSLPLEHYTTLKTSLEELKDLIRNIISLREDPDPLVKIEITEKPQLHPAFCQGCVAGEEGMSISLNPYEKDSIEFDWWNEGYKNSQSFLDR